ncbi:proteoglycan 4 isoform X2 [Hyalella azteca]|uniref:Proteoglycan 4 isoform X2 n=1 Tax=Hyalella azteca TaxID=294128 RepID=A0A8B7PL51_HYAAZ|nr:proteoglycan 4 isoform X2 [Hyalella azteca]
MSIVNSFVMNFMSKKLVCFVLVQIVMTTSATANASEVTLPGYVVTRNQSAGNRTIDFQSNETGSAATQFATPLPLVEAATGPVAATTTEPPASALQVGSAKIGGTQTAGAVDTESGVTEVADSLTTAETVVRSTAFARPLSPATTVTDLAATTLAPEAVTPASVPRPKAASNKIFPSGGTVTFGLPTPAPQVTADTPVAAALIEKFTTSAGVTRSSSNKLIARRSQARATAAEKVLEVAPLLLKVSVSTAVSKIRSIFSRLLKPEPATLTPTEPATLTPTEPATLTPTEPATVTPTEPDTLTPTEPATLTPTEPATLTPTELATLTPIEPATLTPTELATLTPTEAATLTPTEAATLTPTEPAELDTAFYLTTKADQDHPLKPEPSDIEVLKRAPLNPPTEPATLTPTEPATSTSTEPATLTPTEPATLTPTEPPTLTHTEAATLTPTEAATLTPTEPATLTPTEPAELETAFYLTTKADQDHPLKLNLSDIEVLKRAPLNPGGRLIILVHGFKPSGSSSNWTEKMRRELMEADSSSNVVVVDWSKGAEGAVDDEGAEHNRLWNIYSGISQRRRTNLANLVRHMVIELIKSYKQAVKNTEIVARELASLINSLQELHGIPSSRIELIGHSLGAHLSGMTGAYLQEHYGTKVQKITGLDPAKSGYGGNDTYIGLKRGNADELYRITRLVLAKWGYGGNVTYIGLKRGDADELYRITRLVLAKWRYGGNKTYIGLKRGDADEVIVYHTDTVLFGIKDPIGDIDLYINGGKSQPECSGKMLGCSHSYAHEFYNKFLKGCTVVAVRCPSYEMLQDLLLVPCRINSSIRDTDDQ